MDDDELDPREIKTDLLKIRSMSNFFVPIPNHPQSRPVDVRCSVCGVAMRPHVANRYPHSRLVFCPGCWRIEQAHPERQYRRDRRYRKD